MWHWWNKGNIFWHVTNSGFSRFLSWIWLILGKIFFEEIFGVRVFLLQLPFLTTVAWKGHRLFLIRDYFFFFFHQRFFFHLRLFFSSATILAACIKTAGSRALTSRPEIESRPFGSSNGGVKIEGFTVADAILIVGQTRQNLQWMYGKNRHFDAR